MHDEFRVLHTYHSNAIEGNSLTLKETRLVVEEGLTIGGRSLREHLEATNNAKALEWVWDVAKSGIRINHALILRLHALVTQGILELPGAYRTVPVWIAGSKHTPPKPAEVAPLLEALFAELPTIREPALRSIVLHHRLAFVHPFVDGNGRVARLAANLVLLSGRYPPIVLRVSDRLRYYKALQSGDRGNLQPFAALVLRALDESLLAYLAAVYPGYALVPLRTLARRSPYSQEYLSLRARQGALGAVKRDGVWYSSLRSLREYEEDIGRGRAR